MTAVQQPLAIVIPAYKARFLDATLASIAAQTCRDFTVYIGDDASPEGIAAVCERWQSQFDLRYTRFDCNLGGADLVAQWQRCVQLCSAPWVWLFADDDLMPAAGVALLLDAVRAAGDSVDLFHFNVEQIDADGRVLRIEPAFPPRLGVRDFALRRLRFQLSSFAPDYVFSRAAWDRSGGFVPLPRAWCSDDATWIRLGARSGIHTIAGARVGWRNSGFNISSQHGADVLDKTWAQVGFLRWLDAFLQAHPTAAGEPSDAALLACARPWFFQQAKTMRMRFFPGPGTAMAAALAQVRGLSRPRVLLAMLRSDLRRRVIDARAARRAR